MEGGSWISPCGSADANTWVGRQDEDGDIPSHKMVQVGCGGRMSCWGICGDRNVLGSVLSGGCQSMGITDPIGLVKCQPMSWCCFTCDMSRMLRTVFWDGDRFLKVSLPF